MGLYPEPDTNDKKAWLDEHASLLAQGVSAQNIHTTDISEDKILVCNVDNGFFYASAIAFNEREARDFDTPDGRYKWWYAIDKAPAKNNAPMWESYIKG